MKSGGTYHVSVGHETVIGKVYFFGAHELRAGKAINSLDLDNDAFLVQDTYVDEFEDESESENEKYSHSPPPQYAHIAFNQPLFTPVNSTLIGSRLDLTDTDVRCRLAFCGRVMSHEVSERRSRKRATTK